MQKLVFPLFLSGLIASCNTPGLKQEANDIHNAVEITVLGKSIETKDTLTFLKTKYQLSSKYPATIFSFYADYTCTDSLGHKLHSGSIKFNQPLQPNQSLEYVVEACKDKTMIAGFDTLVNKLNYTFKITEIDTVGHN